MFDYDLSMLRGLLVSYEGGAILRCNRVDVTAAEIQSLKSEIAELERAALMISRLLG